jgi:hypothetical protein
LVEAARRAGMNPDIIPMARRMPTVEKTTTGLRAGLPMKSVTSVI